MILINKRSRFTSQNTKIWWILPPFNTFVYWYFIIQVEIVKKHYQIWVWGGNRSSAPLWVSVGLLSWAAPRAHQTQKLHPHECNACFCWGCLLDPYGPSICQFNSSYMWVTHHHLPDYSVCSISHLLWWSLPLPKWMSFQKISKVGASLKFSNNASILVEMYGAVHRHKGRHHRRCLRL